MRTRVLAVILIGSSIVQADILHLRDGSRHYGELVSQDSRQIVFRVVQADGTASLVRTFAAATVARVERTGRCDRPPVDARPASAPSSRVAVDYEQVLREAFELLGDGDLSAALKALQMAAQEASPETLARLSAQCRRERGVPLDELLATLRVQLAARVGRGRGFKLEAATPYERAALARVLQRQADELLARTHQERTVADWAAQRTEYRELQPDARRLVADAARAAALISARLRFDPALQKRSAENVRLAQLHQQLTDLASRVMALSGYQDLTPDDGWVDPALLPTSRPAEP